MSRFAARPRVGRSYRAVLAHIAVGLVIVVVATLVWLLIVALWIDAARQSIPPISAQPLATARSA